MVPSYFIYLFGRDFPILVCAFLHANGFPVLLKVPSAMSQSSRLALLLVSSTRSSLVALPPSVHYCFIERRSTAECQCDISRAIPGVCPCRKSFRGSVLYSADIVPQHRVQAKEHHNLGPELSSPSATSHADQGRRRLIMFSGIR